MNRENAGYYVINLGVMLLAGSLFFYEYHDVFAVFAGRGMFHIVIMTGTAFIVHVIKAGRLYMTFCKRVISGQKAWDLVRNMKESFAIEGLVDISIIGNFIQCITGNFDSRYFNSLKGYAYTLVKSSSNKKKIKAEYRFTICCRKI